MKRSVSAFVTLYNHEKFIVAALESALGQTRPPDEIVVIDDASTDRSLAVAQSIRHPTLRIFAESANLGGSNTMKGLALCNGEYVAILNSDDIWHTEKIERQISYLEAHPNCGVVFTHVRLIDENGVPWKEGTNRLQADFRTKNRDRYSWLRHFFYSGNVFCASSAVIRRECFEKLGPLDGRYAQLQDFEMWLRIAMAGYDFHVIPEPLTNYRVMRNGVSMSANTLPAKSLHAFEYSKILRNYWKIESLADLGRIFPELPISSKADNSLILFYLAIHASKQPTLQHQLFALETMSHWGGDIRSMTIANQSHGFGYVAYRTFLSNSPFHDLLRRGVRGRLEAAAFRFLPFRLYQMLKFALMRRSNKN